jgi:hypothetical protein
MAVKATGTLIRNATPHQKTDMRRPATTGPSAAAPIVHPNQSPIARTRLGPEVVTVISASVFG